MGEYVSHDPSQFVGKLVKIGFRFNGRQNEYMWINVTGNGIGTLINAPVFVDYVHAGDEVHFESVEIVDVEEGND